MAGVRQTNVRTSAWKCRLVTSLACQLHSGCATSSDRSGYAYGRSSNTSDRRAHSLFLAMRTSVSAKPASVTLSTYSYVAHKASRCEDCNGIKEYKVHISDDAVQQDHADDAYPFILLNLGGSHLQTVVLHPTGTGRPDDPFDSSRP